MRLPQYFAVSQYFVEITNYWAAKPVGLHCRDYGIDVFEGVYPYHTMCIKYIDQRRRGTNSMIFL